MVRQEDGSALATWERVFDPAQRERLVSQLRDGLQTRTVADLREAARRWGWRLRGTAKADLAEQLVGYLQDPDIMAAATASLPTEQIVLLAWLTGLSASRDVVRRLQVVLEHGSGLAMPLSQISEFVTDWYERGLLVNGPLGLEASAIYLEWLPATRAEPLRGGGRVAPRPPAMTVEWLADEVQRLLSTIEVERPLRQLQAVDSPARDVHRGRGRIGQVVQPRPGLLDDGTLVAWGYKTPDRRALARLLAELLWALNVIPRRPDRAHHPCAGQLRRVAAARPGRPAGNAPHDLAHTSGQVWGRQLERARHGACPAG